MKWIIFLVLFFYFIRFKKNEEGTAIALKCFGKFSKIIFTWKDYWMDKEGNIWREVKPGEKPEEGSEGKERSKGWDQKIAGGLFVYFPPFQKIHRYKNRWTDIRLRSNKMEVELHEEELDHVLLKPAVYAFELTAVETKPSERIPVDVMVVVTLQIRNPYLFLFAAPPTPIEDILARVSAEMREIISSYTLNELLELKETILCDAIKEKKVIVETLGKWGMVLADKGIEIREIGLSAEYQKASSIKKVEEMKAEGRAQQLMGTVISAVSIAKGDDKNKINAEFKADPDAFYWKHRSLIDSVLSKLSMEERAYFRIETPGAEGGLGDLLRLIGIWKRMPTEGLPAGEPVTSTEPKSTKPVENEKVETEEEVIEKKIEEKIRKGKELTREELTEILYHLLPKLPLEKRSEIRRRLREQVAS